MLMSEFNEINKDYGVYNRGYDREFTLAESDFSNAYNTYLTDEEYKQYAQAAKEAGREKDVFNYDLKGAWKEGVDLKSGHLPDKFKKPNHPTFSEESIYSGKDGFFGGTWSQYAGKQKFRPGRILSKTESERLQQYFAEREPDVTLDLNGLVRSDEFMKRQKLRSNLISNYKPGVFEGSTGFWKAVPEMFLDTASAVVKGMSSLPLEKLGTTEEVKNYWKEQKKSMAQVAQDIQEYNDLNFVANPQVVGTAGIILQNFTKEGLKLVGLSRLVGYPASMIFTAGEHGINEKTRLEALGVDPKTANDARTMKFVTSLIGYSIPAAFGANKMMSALYGATSNTALTIGEVYGIRKILENADCKEVAQDYELTLADTMTALGIGGLAGFAFHRSLSTKRPSQDQVDSALSTLKWDFFNRKGNILNGKDNKIEEANNQLSSDKAQETAAKQMASGKQVSVDEEIQSMSVDLPAVTTVRKGLGTALVINQESDTSSIVVLQNRNRDRVASLNQINSIASNPVYGRLSLSRDSASGAPLVSYGLQKIQDMPPERLGKTDAIYDTDGTEIPVQYAVMEASEVEASNHVTGEWNILYGSQDNVNVIAGNGRMIGLKEAYRRNNASTYKKDLVNDNTHGIDPEAIKAMKEPVLVRIMPPENVTTRFVERSNNSQVLAKSDVETAHQDAPLIRENMSNYTFDEDGSPTAETVRMFMRDINDTNALGEYLTEDGRPNDKAVKRINSAVFYEAYKSDALTELFSDPDNNIRRVLNAMASLAPKVIELRNMGIDIGQSMIEGANAIKAARDNGTFGKDIGEQIDMFGNQSSLPFASVLTENANSAVAIRNILGKTLDFARKSIEAQNDPLFPAEKIDIADVSKFLRDMQNQIRVAQGKPELPAVNVNAIREQMKAIQDTNKAIEKITEVAVKEAEAKPTQEVVDQMRTNAREVLNEDTEMQARLNDIFLNDRDFTMKYTEENGDTVTMSAREYLAQGQREFEQAQREADGIGQAIICVLENKGI